MTKIQVLTALLLSLLFCMANADEQQIADGVWLKNGIDAYNRIVAKQATQDDIANGALISGWVSGVLSEQQERNSIFKMQVGFFEFGYRDAKNKGDKKKAEHFQSLYKNAQIFSPRFIVPDSVTKQQIMAILYKYLSNHPEKWQYSAVSLTNGAMEEAFPASSLEKEIRY